MICESAIVMKSSHFLRETPSEARRRMLREKMRVYRSIQRSHLSDEELAECLAYPPRARTIRGPDWIPCLYCKVLCKVLRSKRGHLAEHNLTVGQYEQKYPGAPLISDTLVAVLSAAGKRSSRAAVNRGSGKIDCRKESVR
jgi:hypothetical protein